VSSCRFGKKDAKHIANALQSSVSFITKACVLSNAREKEERVRNSMNATSDSVCKSELSPAES
jgi:hypothetical protein